MLNKIKSFFKVLVSLTSPVTAKQYLVGYKVGKTIGFSFLAITIFWLAFMISSLLLPYSLLNNKAFTNKVHTQVMEIYDTFKIVTINTIEHMPDFVAFVHAMNTSDSIPVVRFKLLTPDEPYSLIFVVDPQTCKLRDLAHMRYKVFSNALFAICDSLKGVDPLADHLKAVKSPALMITFNTDAHSFFKKNYPVEFKYYEKITKAHLKSVPSDLIDSLDLHAMFRLEVTDKQMVLLSSEENVYKRLRTNEISFTELFTREDSKSSKLVLIDSNYLNIPIPKSTILSALKLGLNSASGQLSNMLIELLSPTVIAAIMPAYLIICVIALPFLVLASILTLSPRAYVLFFGLPGVAIILAIVGIILSKVFKGTSPRFNENLKLALGSALAVFLYRLILYLVILMGLVIGISPLTPWIWQMLHVILFKPSVAFLVALLYMVALKYLAYKELQAVGIQKSITNRTRADSTNENA